MKLLNIILFAILTVLNLASCRNVSAGIERHRCAYDREVFQHVLNYSFAGEFHSVCIEEEFDLAEGEVTGFKDLRRWGGFSFILFTETDRRYVLNLNNDGSLVMFRFD
nr:hypothetical protein [uncultured Treponema sp.]